MGHGSPRSLDRVRQGVRLDSPLGRPRGDALLWRSWSLEPLAMAHIGQMCRGHMNVEHAGWAMAPLQAGVGLRQGCAAALMIFRWTLADAMTLLHGSWVERGCGLCIDDAMTIIHVPWADDKCVMNSTRQGLEEMLRGLALEVHRHCGFVMRWETCGCAQAAGPARAEPNEADTLVLSNLELSGALYSAGDAAQRSGQHSNASAGRNAAFAETSGESAAMRWNTSGCFIWLSFLR